MIKFIKKILGIDILERKVEFLLTAHEGNRNIIALILKTINISPQKFVELIHFNPYELINYNKEVSQLMEKLMDDIIKKEEEKEEKQ